MYTNALTHEEKREKALQDVKLFIANGWDLKEETPEFFLLTRNEASKGVHFLIFLFTFWFTLGITNLIYHLLSKKKKRILK
ncbi:hypothetical protein [Chitinophaga sp. CB10]|uniref:hypothetical protein n=1 Tax=Chitinophaga sp. CB10 TaxID=1891659 RepID=UPI0025C4B57A|nr:hypothetical protein [Chitinophaga sp. CB10]